MPPLPVEEILDQELRALGESGVRRGNLFARFHRQRFSALCLSGGGIRSATFALGVIQGLARKGLLGRFDYLSTVSGGGYIGGWLSSWISRTSLARVTADLSARPSDPLTPETAPVRYLRSFSNYLSPRLGLLSADAWTLVATYLRNLLLNWLAIIPPLVAVLSMPTLLVALVSWLPRGEWVEIQYWIGLLLGAVAILALIAAVRYVHINRPKQRGITEGTGTLDEMRSQRDFLFQCLLPTVIAATAATVCWAWGTSFSSPINDLLHLLPDWQLLGLLGAAVHLLGWLLAAVALRTRNGWQPKRIWRVPIVALSGFAVGAFASMLASFAPPLWALTAQQRSFYVLLGVPVLLAVVMFSSHLYVGFTSIRQSDAEREWSARFSAWLLIAIVSWLSTFGLVLCGPAIIQWIGGQIAASHVLSLQWALGVIGAASGVGAAVAAKGTSRPAAPVKLSARARNTVALVLASVFVAWLIVVLSSAGRMVIERVSHEFDAVDPGSTEGLGITFAIVFGLLVVGLITSRLIDTNRFSLHAMYRARLIRAYLGASRPGGVRDPNPFTGFDDNDNLHLRDLWPQPAPAGGNQRPFHIINATLNVVAGEKLAWQERKAESFTFSPLHCGSANVGYRATQEDPADPESGGYAGDRGISLGTAMAISGAAASPEMGYHSSPVLSLLLTFFNVRLGWWLGNPGPAGESVYQRSSPRLSLRPIIDEAFGRTGDANPYIYLSDGGHFENLGIYEMVLRRCNVIVACDATCDDGSGSDLGNAIRKIRVDLGIPVDMAGDGGTNHGTASCAIGRIRYSCVDPGAKDGTLIHLRPARRKSDPADVRAYASANPAFPNESTADQWFTESQFESYRQLGSHLIEQIVNEDPPARGATMAWFVEQAERYRRN